MLSEQVRPLLYERTESPVVMGIDIPLNAHFQIDRLAKKDYSIALVIAQKLMADEWATVQK